MNKKKIIGVIIFVVLILLIVGLKFLFNGETGTISGNYTTVYVATGGGKEDFIADEDVVKIRRRC